MAVTGTTPRTLQLFTKTNGARSTIDPALAKQIQSSALFDAQTIGAPQLTARSPVSGGLAYPTPHATNDIWVSTSGVDGAAGTQSAPLRTIAAAVAAASPSGRRRIIYRGGTYTPPATFSGSIRGNVSQPIEHIAMPGEVATWNTSAVDINGVPYENLSYWNLWGLNIACGNIGLQVWNNPSDHLGFYYLTGTKTSNRGDNDGILFFEGTNNADFIDISLCKFKSTAPNSGNNSALIYMAFVHNFLVAGNILDGTQKPYYQKHDDATTSSPTQYSRVVKNNLAKNGGESMYINMAGTRYYNNAHDNCGLGLGDPNGVALAFGRAFFVDHNTFYNGGASFYGDPPNCNGTTYTNNVHAGNSRLRFDRAGGQPNQISWAAFDNNAYQTGASQSPFYINFSNMTFAQWRAAFPSLDVNGLSANAAFQPGWASGSEDPTQWAVSTPSGIVTRQLGCDATKLLTVN